MMQWNVIFQKEMTELWRNRKWIWVPLVLIIIAIMDPISTYYLPQIIEYSGGLPEGAIIEIPTPSSAEVVMMSIEQLNMFGVLIIIFMSMGAISGERKSGIADLILVKPIKYEHYVTAKWASYGLLTFISLSIALLMSFYYINILFDQITFTTLVKAWLFYSLWFILVITLSIFFNTLTRSSGYVATLTIITLLFMALINIIFGHRLTFFPNKLSEHIFTMLQTGTVSTDLTFTAIITLTLSIILLISSSMIFKYKEKAL